MKTRSPSAAHRWTVAVSPGKARNTCVKALWAASLPTMSGMLGCFRTTSSVRSSMSASALERAQACSNRFTNSVAAMSFASIGVILHRMARRHRIKLSITIVPHA